MKKYIIGLFSAICLMGAGCTEFEDYAPVNMGEGPAVTLSVEKTNVDAFNLTVTPAEGTVYYAYIVTNQAQTIDAETLLQAGYEGAELLKAAETPSLSKAYNNQTIGTTYYVYAVASDANGLCGAVASATVDLPDTEAPYLVSVPDGYLYTASNHGRSITLTYNETVTRGEGAITYNVTKGDLTSYASGAIETVVINGESVTITLPESVAFDANEAKSYVFLDFAAGAFVDGAGNQSAALKGGVDQETQIVSAPYWEYVPGGSTGDSEFTGTFGFMFYQYDFQTQQPGTDPYGFDTEFELKHEDNPDTIVIKNFYFEASAFTAGENSLEAVVEGNNFKIADMLPMGVIPMRDQSGASFNCLVCFAGVPESENEQFEWVNFNATDAQGVTGYVADRWCGLYLFNFDLIQNPDAEGFNLGWYDVWNLAVFMKGSVQASPSAGINATAPVVKKLGVRQVDWSLFRPLTGSEKAKAQRAVKGIKAKRF